MAPENRREAAALKLLAEHAPEFEFFQAVRLLRLHVQGGRAPEAAGGRWDELIRFRSHVGYSYMASDVQRIEATPGKPPVVTVNFLGIVSPSSRGSLPTFYTQFVLDEARGASGDGANEAPRDFFDLFNDRLIALFFRSLIKNSLPLQYELAGRNELTGMLFGLLGLGVAGVRDRAGIDPRTLVYLGGLLLRRPTTTACLEFVLSAWFGIRFEILPFVPTMAALAPESRWRLGHNGELGNTIALGDRARIAQGKFRLVSEPLRWEQFASLLPGRTPADHPARLTELVALVRQAVGGEFDWDLQLVLAATEVPDRILLNSADPGRARLGLSTWLGKRLLGGDARDTIVQSSLVESPSS